MPKGRVSLSLEARFFRHTEWRENGCLEWIAAKNDRGYGMFNRIPNTILAHRMAYILAHGEIEKFSVIMHTCDNPSCVNVEHLRLGSHLENQRDKMAKGRGNNGERHYKAKLTDEQVREIRSSPLLQRELAKKFGISRCHISEIQTRKNWTHI